MGPSGSCYTTVLQPRGYGALVYSIERAKNALVKDFPDLLLEADVSAYEGVRIVAI